MCPAHSVSGSGSDSPADCSCIGGYHGENGATCAKCPVDSYCVGGNSVTSCPANSGSRIGSNSSLDCTCKDGWSGEDGGVCTLCDAGFWCHAGMINACPENSDSVAGIGTLLDCKCPLGYTGQNGDACIGCSSGAYKNTIGNATCSLCAVDTYSTTIAATSNVQCINCPANTAAVQGSNVLVACKCLMGYNGTDGTQCTPCPAGTYKQQPGDGACILCGIDTFSTTTAASHPLGMCVQCEAGFLCSAGVKTACPFGTSSIAGSEEQTSCTCLAGYIGEDGVECTPCPAGTYKTQQGDGVCVLCPINTYSTTIAATTSDACENCSVQALSPSGSNKTSDCRCKEGYYNTAI
ncbi:hypothetical protein T484DRAFT_1610868 [Baffinella frigidus]|nr:hypothetical protein T484DRAFT_1610868 [Cryptophyta sp. CCMP2293]